MISDQSDNDQIIGRHGKKQLVKKLSIEGGEARVWGRGKREEEEEVNSS